MPNNLNDIFACPPVPACEADTCRTRFRRLVLMFYRWSTIRSRPHEGLSFAEALGCVVEALSHIVR